MTALVAGDGDALNIFFNGTFHNFMNTSVMTQVNDLRALALKDASHDIDCRVMPVEERGGRYNPDLVLWLNIHVQVELGTGQS